MSIVIDGTLGVSGVQDGIISESKLATGAVTDTKLTLTPNSQEVKDALNATGSAPIYACRAWVNFNGTGTVAIRASGNVSSITDNGTGDYTVNLTTALQDTNGVVVCNTSGNHTTYGANAIDAIISGAQQFSTSHPSASAFRIYTNIYWGSTNALSRTDKDDINVAIFR